MSLLEYIFGGKPIFAIILTNPNMTEQNGIHSQINLYQKIKVQMLFW